jgi:hypothetical protein
MAIDALIWRIEIPGVRPRELVESVNLHLELDAQAAVPDVGAITALAQAVRSDQALGRLLGFLVRISNTSEAGRAPQQALEAIDAMLASPQGQCRCAAAVRAVC